jgi:hypothetical protein
MLEGKIRRHIKVSSEKEFDFKDVVSMLIDVMKNIIKDELVSFVYIEDGLKEGTFNLDENGEMAYIPKEGTMMRVFTKKSRWSFILIKRNRKEGFVTLIDISAPKKEEEKFMEVLECLISETEGEISGDI